MLLYWTAFFDIMGREWAGIDYLRYATSAYSTPHSAITCIRIDKFMMLVSQVLQDSFLYLKVGSL